MLGASLGMAVHERRISKHLAVWARRAEVRIECVELSWCDQVFETAEEAAAEADLVVVCAPVGIIQELVARIAPALKPDAIVTDVGSTKSLICRNCHAAMPEGTTFVGAHPMAGSEKSGMKHAAVRLFDRKACFVTPLLDTPEKAVELVVRFWKEMDMEVETVSPEKHDEIVANISHLPHIIATVLCSYLAAKDSNWRNFAGEGLRDTTRIAAGNPNLWKAIIEQNRDEILRAIRDFEGELQPFKSAIANNQIFEILNFLERGKTYRDRLRPDTGD